MMRSVAIASVIWAFSGCAATIPRAPSEGPPRSMLEVVNRTALDWEISVDGWRVGTVVAGERRGFRELRPGKWLVRADRPGYSTKTRSLTASAGGTATWELLPPAPRAPLAMPPPFGTLILVNQTGRDLDFKLDTDQALRTLLNGDTRRVLDVSAGRRQLEVTAPGSRYRRLLLVPVRSGADTRFNVPLETGSVALTNRTGEAVRLFVDGIERLTVSDNTRTPVENLLVGLHSLRAVGADTDKEHFRRIQTQRDEVIVWDLSAAQGRLEVVNHSGDVVEVAVDGAARGPLGPGKTLAMKDVALGLRRVTALGRRTAYRWSADMPVTAGHALTWTLRNDVGTLRVVNRLTEVIQVRVRGEKLGTVPPGGALFLDELPAGELKVTAFSERSRIKQTRVIHATPERSIVWVVDAPHARVHVRNKKPESVIVYADQRPLGRVPAGGQIIFTQVPPGDRLLEARGDLSEDTTRARRTLTVDGIVVWDVVASAGVITVHNASDEALVAPPALKPQAPSIPVGRKHTYRVPVGHRMLHFIGRDSGQSYFKRFHVTVGGPLVWKIAVLEGMLHVYNRTKEAVLVHIDREPPFRIPAEKVAKVAVRAGPHRLVAVGVQSKDARESTVVIKPRAVHGWEVVGGVGYVRITNTTGEIVDLRRDGEALGVVESQAQRSYGPWPPGTYDIRAQGRWSRAIYRVRLEVVAGRVEVWTIHPARGAVLVSNRRSEAVRVIVDSESAGVVEAHKEGRFELPLGPHLIEIVGRDTLAIFRQRLRVRPDRTYSVAAPAGPSILVVSNRLPIPLQLRIDDRERGTAAPGATLTIPLNVLGRLTVHAIAPDGRLVWHRRIEVSGDQQLHWEITP